VRLVIVQSPKSWPCGKDEVRTALPGCALAIASSRNGGDMTDKVDKLASDVDDALVSADELEDDPGDIKGKTIGKVKEALAKAKETTDEMEDVED
jgi:outer membrane murein-binding lipoprotein Lpp